VTSVDVSSVTANWARVSLKATVAALIPLVVFEVILLVAAPLATSMVMDK
jgi:hypothetical protein